jgi:hypothetical protein
MNCALCQKNAELRNSHIIPELVYKPMYDDKHRFMQINPKQSHVSHHQKGFRQRLLCQQCETYLSKSENYVRRFLYGGTGYYVRQHGPISFLTGLNYHQIRIFFLSVLWRMSVCTLKVFNSVSLGPHQERIRRMLLADDPGEPDQYGFFAVVPIIDGKFFTDWILEPDWIRYENRRLYRAVIGGILYMFTASNQPLVPPHPCLFIQKNGDWILQQRDVRKIEFLRRWFDEASKVK